MRRLCMILSCHTATYWSQLRVIVSEFRWQLWLSGVALRTQACDLILDVGVDWCHGLEGCAASLQSLAPAYNDIWGRHNCWCWVLNTSTNSKGGSLLRLVDRWLVHKDLLVSFDVFERWVVIFHLGAPDVDGCVLNSDIISRRDISCLQRGELCKAWLLDSRLHIYLRRVDPLAVPRLLAFLGILLAEWKTGISLLSHDRCHFLDMWLSVNCSWRGYQAIVRLLGWGCCLIE